METGRQHKIVLITISYMVGFSSSPLLRVGIFIVAHAGIRASLSASAK